MNKLHYLSLIVFVVLATAVFSVGAGMAQEDGSTVSLEALSIDDPTPRPNG